MSDDLDENDKDKIIAASRAVAGIIPIFGGAVGEALNTVPGLRIDRVISYARKLNERVSKLEQSIDPTEPENVGFIEDGAIQAARATSETRIDYIAHIVSSGLKLDGIDQIRQKRLLRLLDQIDDDEIIILNAYCQSYGSSSNDRSHWDVVVRPKSHSQASGSREIIDNNLYELGKNNLLRLGLLEEKVRNRKSSPVSIEVSFLGRHFMSRIGLPADIDVRSKTFED
ncbi:hypothetical protein ACJ3XI_09995 [Litorimonas sp. RW-G-Af-16]|uniref:hypothetical protein n=1 Tax=Litorimonas sp. RW-G-Af-16 TaxID=3241168 RepID=UPI00390CA91F